MKEKLYLETLTEFVRLRTSFERVTTPVAAQFGLTPIQAVTLHLISKTPSATVSGIIKELDLNQGNVSTVCKKLESDGFIRREKSSGDERISVIFLTKKGDAALAGMGAAMPCPIPGYNEHDNDEIRRATEGLEALKNIAQKLNTAICENEKKKEI